MIVGARNQMRNKIQSILQDSALEKIEMNARDLAELIAKNAEVKVPIHLKELYDAEEELSSARREINEKRGTEG